MADYTINTAGSDSVTIPSDIRPGDRLIFNNTSTGRIGTILNYQIPIEGIYKITAMGAQGGSGDYTGGLGAKIVGQFKFLPDEVLNIVVGQQGIDAYDDAGGGGGSFVWKESEGREEDPLVAAGGGGGSGDYSSPTGGTLDKNGLSGDDGCDNGGVDGHGGTDPTYSDTGCGMGWYSDGAGHGGFHDTFYGGDDSYDGGFGGGGAGDSSNGGGGGGGYSGGGGACDHEHAGGGGGSIVKSTGTYLESESSADFNSDHGQVIIEVVDLVLGYFEGYVTNLGSSVEGAKVYALNLQTDEIESVVLTDSEGHYYLEVSFDKDEPLNYCLFVEYQDESDNYHSFVKPYVNPDMVYF